MEHLRLLMFPDNVRNVLDLSGTGGRLKNVSLSTY